MAEQPTASLLNTLREAGFASLPGHWQVCTLGELLSDDRGISVGVMYPGDHDPDGIPLIKAGDIARNRIESTPEFCISSGVHDEYRRTELAGGEILMTLVGDVGRCAIVPASARGWNAARAVAVIRLSDPTDADYVRACLLSRQLRHLMDVWSNTTVQQTLNLKEIKQLPIPWPPRKEREAIASIGRSIDHKIDLLRRMNGTLEDTCRTLFQSWFVDFDPVRAKAAGRTLGGINETAAELFPGGLEDSDVGPIPAGWKVATLGDYVSLQRGTTYQSALLEQPGPVLLGLASIQRDGGFRADSLKTYGGESAEKLILRPGDLYVSLKDVTQSGDLLGAVARVPRWVTMGRLTQDTVKLVPMSANISMEYIYWLLRMSRYREYCRLRAIGTTNLSLSRDDFLGYRFAVPPQAVQERLLPILERMSERLEDLSESRTLAAIRDTLLPKLLSGALRIPDPERFLKEAGV